MKKYLLFLLLLVTLVLFTGCQSSSGDKPNTDASNITAATQPTETTSPTETVQPTEATTPTETAQPTTATQPTKKANLNADEISSVTIKIFTSLNGGPTQKNITDKALIGEMVTYWNAVELKNKTEMPKPGTTLSVVFNSDIAFSICSGYLGYAGNYYEQPAGLEEQFKKYYSLAEEDSEPVYRASGFDGDKLYVNIDGNTLVYERHEAGIGSLTKKTVLDTFYTATKIEGIVWNIYSAEEFPDLSYVLVISGTNSKWTYRIAKETQ